MAFPQPAKSQQKTLAPAEFLNWLPITDAERDQKTPLVEKDAGAEVLLWRVRVVDEFLGDNRSFQRAFYNYVRVKIFDDSGKEKAATVDLPYREPGGIISVSGRTIRADGSIVELDRNTVYKRDLERVRGLRQKVVSFAMPGVEKGAIIEYRWKQTEDDNRFRYVRLHFQREFPVQKVTYFVRPLSSERVVEENLYIAPFNCKTSPIKQENDGYQSTTVENVPAAHYESWAPSEPNVEPWALLYYRQGGLKDPTKYWDERGKELYKQFKDSLKSDGETKAAAATAMQGANDENGKLVALAAFVRKSVRNVRDPQLTSAERESFFQKLPKDRPRNSTEILKSGIGMSQEMNIAFAALAIQAGFDVRPVLVADRAELLFSPVLADRYFLNNEAIAVKSGDSWKVFDIGDKTVPPSILPWHEEGMYALLGDAKAPSFIQTSMAPADQSAESRSAKLKLSRDGSLSGDVDESYSGHRGEDYRREIATKTPAQREEWLHDRVVRTFPDAEVTGVRFADVDDASKPLATHYHLEAPRFAQVTSKRILFQPNAFRRSQVSPFSAAKRYNPIEFPYAWKEADSIKIQLPEGFVLDNAASPGSLSFGKPGSYDLSISVTKGDPQELSFTRSLTFGNDSTVFFDATAYPALKKVFDTVQLRDSWAISLKEN